MEEILGRLTNQIKQYNKIVIMTHKNIDLDGLGSSLCLYSIVKSFNKECYICLNRRGLSRSVHKAIEHLQLENVSVDFINKTTLRKVDPTNTLLIILDTYKKNIFEDETILNVFENVIIIDHHVVNNDDLIETKLTYIDSKISSTIEIMVNYLRYLNKIVDPIIATIMLAGMEIDTNNFKVKTTEKTYKAAAFLTSLGASNVLKQEILQETREEYFKRQKFIENSYMINKNTTLCTLDNNVYDKKDLATIAEELLQIEDIEASFVIGKVGKRTVGVSARSVGTVDVFKVCKKLGGGGHITNAAAQIQNKTISEVKEKLLKIIK